MGEGLGRLVAGRYRLSAVLGRGGMGVVWRARDERLGRAVAVKEVRLPFQIDGDAAARWYARARREAASAAAARHPGIITIHDILEADGRPWIVMELIAGHSLAEQIRDRGRLSPRETASIGARILSALRAAHAAGVVHRDVKPANVLLEGDRVVITDFGIATLEGGTLLTQTGVLGTPAYMAPEHISGRATAASDLWSLGATLFTAVEGRPPFDGPTPMAISAAVLTAEPATSVHAGQLRPVLEGLLTKDLAYRLDADGAAALLDEVRDEKTQPPKTAADQNLDPPPERPRLQPRRHGGVLRPRRGTVPAAQPDRHGRDIRRLLRRTCLWRRCRVHGRRVVDHPRRVRAGLRAAALLADRAAEYFTLGQDAPYMSMASGVTELARERIPSVVHVNGTARLQTVTPDRNPFLAAVLRRSPHGPGFPC